MQFGFLNLCAKGGKSQSAYQETKIRRSDPTIYDIAATYAPQSKELHFNIGNAWFSSRKYDKAMENTKMWWERRTSS
jgi:hypothetical protein